jgi:hypothetical protein
VEVVGFHHREGHRIGQRELTSAERDCRALDPSLSLIYWTASAIDRP